MYSQHVHCGGVCENMSVCLLDFRLVGGTLFAPALLRKHDCVTCLASHLYCGLVVDTFLVEQGPRRFRVINETSTQIRCTHTHR